MFKFLCYLTLLECRSQWLCNCGNFLSNLAVL